VLGRVVSSYTPTLAALGRARRPGRHAHPRHLTIALPETPGQPPLPAVHDELTVLSRHFPPGQSSQQLAGHHATRNTVLAALATCSWVHFACHAVQHNADPDRSGFALWDSPLTIADLADQAVQSHDLAFLSACQTAAGSTRHLDEAIHLAAAMQFLGYRHVIATMWTAADPPAPEVANAVYTKLTEHGPPQPGRAAEALHQAVRSLRRNYPANPLVWAPYIHLGPCRGDEEPIRTRRHANPWTYMSHRNSLNRTVLTRAGQES
jgi:CHAT domain-containing protein